ncbi:MAG: Protein-disulfide isomerase [Pseudonocardiales bacterium]|nr:Protein-disulfide isomerase [Pseudonocardiales bacterium]
MIGTRAESRVVNWYSIRAWLGTVIRLLLGVVWIWAGWSKLHNPRGFLQTIRAYDATPEWLSKAIGYGLPVLEICLGVLLIVGIAVRIAAAVSALLFLVFLIGLIEAAARGIKLECGCFGGGGQTAGSTHYTLDILRDVGLLVLAAYLVVWSMTRLSLEEFLARHDYVEPPSPKRMRSEQGQRKYNVMLEQRRKAARERAMYINSSLAIVVVLVSIIGIGVQSGRAKIQGDLTATNATVTNGVVYGKAAAATVDVYEDFQCPHCLTFEQSARATLEADVKANKAQVRYHTLAFLDSASNGNRYSSRAANAGLCASDVSVDEFVKFHDILFSASVQPKEGTSGRTDAELVKYAQQAGITSTKLTTFTTCVQNETHKALVQAITDGASKRSVTSTPTVLVNGKKLGTVDLPSLTTAIAAADAKGPAPSPSPTASPTASSTASSTASKSPTPSASKSP